MRRGDAHKREIAAVVRLVRMLGGEANVLHQVGRVRGSAGVPDLYLQLPRRGPNPARACWLEVKVGRDRLSEAQKAFLRRSADAVGDPVIVGDLETLLQWLDATRKGPCTNKTANQASAPTPTGTSGSGGKSETPGSGPTVARATTGRSPNWKRGWTS